MKIESLLRFSEIPLSSSASFTHNDNVKLNFFSSQETKSVRLSGLLDLGLSIRVRIFHAPDFMVLVHEVFRSHVSGHNFSDECR